MGPRLVRVVLATAMCCAAHTSHAQVASSENPIRIGFAIGGEQGTDAFGRPQVYPAAAGFVLGVQVQLPPLPIRRLAFRGELAFHGYPGGDCVFIVAPRGSYGGSCGHPLNNLLVASGAIVARLNDPATRWSPYALGGIALSAGSTNSDPLSSPAGVHYGLGFEVRPAKKTNVFAEWRHTTVGVGGLSSVVLGARF